jgi:predicted transcriptional regulator of viral defense system
VTLIAPTVLRDVIPRSPVFTTGDVVAATGATPDIASRALSRLARRGLITRLVRGLWGATQHPDFSPYAVVPFLLARAANRGRDAPQGYVSFISALHLHGMLSQIPGAIHVAVSEQRAAMRTPAGEYRFHRLQPELLGGHQAGDPYGRFELATPTKAIFDTLYLSARRGRQFGRLPELELPRTVTDREMQQWIQRIGSDPLRAAVGQRWAQLRAQHLRARGRHSGGAAKPVSHRSAGR